MSDTTPRLTDDDLSRIIAAFEASTDALIARLERSPVFVQAVAEQVAQRTREPASLLTAEDVAAALGVTRTFVYEHQESLGVRRLGTSRKPRIRFDHEAVQRFLAKREKENPNTRAVRHGTRK